MHGPRGFIRRIRGPLAVALIVLAAGCSLLPSDGEPELPPPPPEIPAPEPVVVEPAPPAPLPPPPAPKPPPPPMPKVAIVLSDSRDAYQEVADELERLLNRYTTYNLAGEIDEAAQTFAAIGASDAAVVVAIGLPAARQAAELSPVPTVFCQVFNVNDNQLLQGDMRGVAATPPLHLQLRAWKAFDPSLEHVGLIVGEGHEALIDEAREATQLEALTLHAQVALSDRETRYQFDRMVATIDGFWLFPDNRVLSRPVLKHVFTMAGQRRVQIAVFNESLLQLGAAISSTAVAEDIAATTKAVAERLARGQPVPPMTPLSDIRVQVNEQLAKGGRSSDAVINADSRAANTP